MRRTWPLLAPRNLSRALAVTTLVVLSIGCAAPAAQERSQAPSMSAEANGSAALETASPSQMPSPTPTEVPQPSASAPDGRADIAEVVTTDLVMRSAPSTGPDSEIYSPSLSAPTLLYVLDGPVAANGYDWYRVVRFEEFPSDIGPAGPGVGWVADGGQDGEIWIAPWTGTCPPLTAEDLMWRSQLLVLACFGDRELTLEGTLGNCDGVPSDVVPSWVDGCLLVPFGAPPGRLLAGFAFSVESATPELGEGTAVRVTGHYDDPAALTCVTNDWGGLDQPSPDLKVLACRAKFVATEITPTSAP